MSFDFDLAVARLARELQDKKPDDIIDNHIFDAINTYDVATQRRAALAEVPSFDLTWLDHLPEMWKALQEAQLRAKHAQVDKLEASLRPVREEADELIDTVTHAGSYVLRDNARAQVELDLIGDTGAMPDRVGDLNRVAALCRTYPRLLEEDKQIPPNAAERAEALALKLAGAAVDAGSTEAQRRRNLAFWLVDRAMNEVQAVVRYRFPKDKKFVAEVCRRFKPVRRRASGEEPTPPQNG